MLKTLLVTSRVTFVPDNYNAMVARLATCPFVGGLLVLDNANLRLAARAVGAVAFGARRLGWQLLRNQFGRSNRRRLKAYADAGKPIWELETVNCEQAHDIVREHDFDLVINARTRVIYGKKILGLPRLGCLNVHHGLLPDQRGTMCDMWSLYDGLETGFSIHHMTTKVDDGDIVARERTSTGDERDYLAYLQRTSEREAVVVDQLLARIDRNGMPPGTPNRADSVVYARTPALRQIPRIRKLLRI